MASPGPPFPSQVQVTGGADERSFPQLVVAPPRHFAPAQIAPSQQPGLRRLGLGAPLAWGWVLGPGLLLLYWSVLSATGWLDPRVLPAPWTAVETAIELIRDGRLQDNLAVSAWRAAQGSSSARPSGSCSPCCPG